MTETNLAFTCIRGANNHTEDCCCLETDPHANYLHGLIISLTASAQFDLSKCQVPGPGPVSVDVDHGIFLIGICHRGSKYTQLEWTIGNVLIAKNVGNLLGTCFPAKELRCHGYRFKAYSPGLLSYLSTLLDPNSGSLRRGSYFGYHVS